MAASVRAKRSSRGKGKGDKADEGRAGHNGRLAARTSDAFPRATPVAFACNVEVLCPMLREGYLERRVDRAVACHTLHALIQAHQQQAQEEEAAESAADAHQEAPVPPEARVVEDPLAPAGAAALAGPPPSHLLRPLAEAAWRLVHDAKVRAGARLGRDAALAEARRELTVLGPNALVALMDELRVAVGEPEGADVAAPDPVSLA